MGACYFYCNLDKLEYFSIGLGFAGNKRSAIGAGPGGRLFLDLLQRGSGGDEGRLHWAGDRIAILADDHPVPGDIGLPPTFLQYEQVSELLRDRFTDVTERALREVLRGYEAELAEWVGETAPLFEKLGAWANAGDAEIEAWLRKHFGRDWRKEHAKRCR
jgi:hypothetical protein